MKQEEQVWGRDFNRRIGRKRGTETPENSSPSHEDTKKPLTRNASGLVVVAISRTLRRSLRELENRRGAINRSHCWCFQKSALASEDRDHNREGIAAAALKGYRPSK